MEKNRAHNLTEVKALIKESYQDGTELNFNKTRWYSHNDKFLCTSTIFDTEFELTVEDVEALDGYRSVTIEVL